jgi:hypothetical protein
MNTPGDMTFDLNGMLDKFLCSRIDAYVEPKSKKEGKPFKQVYHASLYALTSRTLPMQAELLGIGYDTLRTTRARPKFKALVAQHLADFANEVLAGMLTETVSRCQDRWKHAQSADPLPYVQASVQILHGYLSWECYQRLIMVVTAAIADTEGFKRIVCGAMGADVDEFHLYAMGLELHSMFLRPLLEGARKDHKQTRKALEVYRVASFDAQLAACSRLVLSESRHPGNETDEERAATIGLCITALMKVHRLQLPKLTRQGEGV